MARQSFFLNCNVLGLCTGIEIDFSRLRCLRCSLDGNCLFSSISHQLCVLEIDVVERSAHDIRTELVNVLENDSQLVARVAQGLAKGLKCKFTTVFTRVGMMVLYF